MPGERECLNWALRRFEGDSTTRTDRNKWGTGEFATSKEEMAIGRGINIHPHRSDRRTVTTVSNLSHECSYNSSSADGERIPDPNIDYQQMELNQDICPGTDGKSASWYNSSQGPINSSNFNGSGANTLRTGELNVQVQDRYHQQLPTQNSAISNRDNTNADLSTLHLNQPCSSGPEQQGSIPAENGNGYAEPRKIYRKGTINRNPNVMSPCINAPEEYEESYLSDNKNTSAASLPPGPPIYRKGVTGISPSTVTTATATTASEQIRKRTLSATDTTATSIVLPSASSLTNGRRNSITESVEDTLEPSNNSLSNSAPFSHPSFQQRRRTSIRSIGTATDISSAATTSLTGYEDDEDQGNDAKMSSEDDLHAMNLLNLSSSNSNKRRKKVIKPHQDHAATMNNNNNPNDLTNQHMNVNAAAALSDLALSNRGNTGASNLPSHPPITAIANAATNAKAPYPASFATATTPALPPATNYSNYPQFGHLDHLPPQALQGQHDIPLTSVTNSISLDSVEREIRRELLMKAQRCRNLSDHLMNFANCGDLGQTMLIPLPSNDLRQMSSLPPPPPVAAATSWPVQQQQPHHQLFDNNPRQTLVNNDIATNHAAFGTGDTFAGGAGIGFNTNPSSNALVLQRLKQMDQARKNSFPYLSQQAQQQQFNLSNATNDMSVIGNNLTAAEVLPLSQQQIHSRIPTMGDAAHRMMTASPSAGIINHDPVVKSLPQDEWRHLNNSTLMSHSTPMQTDMNGSTLGSNRGGRSAMPDSMPMPPLVQNLQLTKVSSGSKSTGGVNNGTMPPLPPMQDLVEDEELKEEEHYTKRPFVPLGTQSDYMWLSDFLIFLRSKCIEVFEASTQSVVERKRYKQIFPNQVGIRCRFCAHLPYANRGKRSSSFPKTQCRMYQSVTMMIREHYSVCGEMPADIRQEYDRKKAKTKRGEMEAKRYWLESTQKLGLVDTPFGIFYQEKAMKDDFQRMQRGMKL